MKRRSLLKDLIGQIFGKWTVIRLYRNKRNRKNVRVTKWLCQCVCGTVRAVFASSLTSGGTLSCGCSKTSTAGKGRVHFFALADQRFGNWTVLYRAPNKGPNTRWWCRCVCGVERAVHAATLREGTSRSCGCSRPPIANPKAVIDLIGQRFGKLLVVERAPSQAGSRYAWWAVRCDCGKQYAVSGAALRAGQHSCGCVKAKHRKHGHTAIDPEHPDRDRHSPTYRSWQAMLNRCLNPKSQHWPQYGGRGITVCKRWRVGFVKFLADMGIRPEGHTLDRFPDNGGNYKPGNCRWATPAEQAANRVTTVELRRKVEQLEQQVIRLKRRLSRKPDSKDSDLR